MRVPELLGPHFKKPVGIFGMGLSGKAVAQVLDSVQVPYIFYDKDVTLRVSGDFTKDTAEQHTLIVYSPGFPSNHVWLNVAKESGCVCLGELDFGALFWNGKIIAVTGTNGKSTLTSLLAEALNSLGGSRAIACGNIGNPLTAQYPHFDDPQAIAVCEVSSFQAETIEHFSPDVLIWTTFDEDHLDRHFDLKSYFDAKWRLVNRLKTENLFIGATVANYAKQHKYLLPTGAIIVEGQGVGDGMLSEGIFVSLPQSENYLLALAYWDSQDFDIEVLKKVSSAFQPLPHRLKKIAEIEKVGFWNDSKGTNFSATIAALRGFKKPIFWIGGGKIKGGDQDAFVKELTLYIEEAFLIGESAPILERKLKENKIRTQCFASLEEATEAALSRALLAGGEYELVFSPGFSSFDMFMNAEERGKFFEKKVLELKMKQNTLEVIKDP